MLLEQTKGVVIINSRYKINNNLNNNNNTHMKETNNLALEPTENKVLIEFANRLGVTPMQIIAKNEIRHICDIRQLYCKLRYEIHGATYLEIAHEIDRNPTTVRNGVMRINNLLDVDNIKIATMWNRIKDTPGYYYVTPTAVDYKANTA